MSGATQIHDQAGPAAPRGISRGRGMAVKGAMLLDAVLDQMADGVIIADAEGRIRRVNPAAARMHGRAVTDIAPEDWSRSYDLLRTDGEPYPPEELALTRALRDGEVVEGEEWIVRRPDGTQVRLLGSAAPLRDHRGRRLGAVLVMRDVTERERLAQALRAETAAKERFFAQMSHELRTPVNAVSGYCTLLLDGVAGPLPEAAAGMIDRMARCAQHLRALVDDLLDLGRLDAGRLQLARGGVPPRPAARHARRAGAAGPRPGAGAGAGRVRGPPRCAPTRSGSGRSCSTCCPTRSSSPSAAG